MSKNALVIVESPTKAKTIRKFLPKNFVVEASMGHVRDLPQSATDIPEALKKEEWAKIGVNVEKDFEPLYVIQKGKAKIIQDLRRKLKEADELYLATDEDREGESISWHLLEILKPTIPVKRMVFHEITKVAIERALKEVRDLDLRLVRAQEARRILDRLVGYSLSPLLWKKIAYGLSAGRVQSAGLSLIVERERERLKFKSSKFWDLFADLKKGENFKSRLVNVSGSKVATGKDFDESTGLLRNTRDEKIVALNEDDAKKIMERIKDTDWIVKSVDEKSFNSKPSIPFITSSLQQEANRKLGMSARETMRTAQKLYEEGWITYMRTDSPNLSQEAIQGARTAVMDRYGKEYLSPEVRQFSSKAKGAQEAHEAIRPAGSEFKLPRETGITGRELQLYEMIWMRTVATQMAEAQKLSVSVKITVGDCEFSSTGTRIIFPGFLKAYTEGSDDPEAALEDKEVVLPKLKIGDKVDLVKVDPQFHETKPPARYTEASIIQKLEKEGVGRPSTYASIIDTIVDRGYVKRVNNSLVPTFTGIAVIQLLEKHFKPFVDLGFTSKMEASLDDIAEGDLEWLPYLKEFFLGKNGLQNQIKREEKNIDPEESRSVNLAHIKDVKIKIGRYGAYIVKESEKKDEEELHATIPEDIAPADLSPKITEELIENSKKGPQSLGQHPKTGENIYCLIGRFGPYVQLGEITEAVPKPKRAGLLKGMEPKTLTLDQAIQLLSLPRELGVHPTSNKQILANQGRFGPYILHDGEFRSLKKEDNLFTIDLKRALEILSEEKKSRRSSSKLIKDFGKHPEDQKPIAMYDGKYGLYIKHGSVNATVPQGADPEKMTVADALAVLQARNELKKKKRKGKA